MEATEKAKELVNKFWNINPTYLKLVTTKNNPDYTQAKQSALIAVDEMIVFNGDLWLDHKIETVYYKKENARLFNIKTEIEKL